MIDAEELNADEKMSDAKVKDLFVRCRTCMNECREMDELELKRELDFFEGIQGKRRFMCQCLQFVSENVESLKSSSVEELELKLEVMGF